MKVLASIYQIFIVVGKWLQPFLLLALRLFWGWQFFQAGFGKLQNMDHVIEFFNSLQIPAPTFFAYLVAWVETIGGIFLFFGFLSRLAAVPLIITMVTALSTAHVSASEAILIDPSEFINQMPVTFLIVAFVVFCFGPGLFSLDALFKRSICKKEKV